MCEFVGMTVNERLFHMGLLSVWDRAVELGDKKELREILKKIELVDQADTIISSVCNQHGRPSI